MSLIEREDLETRIMNLIGVTLIGITLISCAHERSQGEEEGWSTAYRGKADIYGEDSRLELNDPSVPEHYRALSDSIAMVVSTPTLLDVSAGSVSFRRTSMSDKFWGEKGGPLCEEEPFADQIAPGYCSAFLITPELIATAGHCVNGQTRCEQMGFAFGYALKRPALDPYEVPLNQFYRCDSLIGRVHNPFEEPEAIEQREYWYDWAVIKLDRPVTDHLPVQLAPLGSKIERGKGLVMIGHPSGLPMKVTEGAVVSSEKDRYFNTTLDVYKGNSGSAVFGARDGAVHGIAIRGSGGNSFELVSDAAGGVCGRSQVCEEVGSGRRCIGNHALRVDPLHIFTREGLKVSERHALIDYEDRRRTFYSFSFDEEGEVDFATVHLNGGAASPQDMRVILHHGDQNIEVMSTPKELPYGRWTMTTERFAGVAIQGEWVIEVINEGDQTHMIEWAQVMLGHHSP